MRTVAKLAGVEAKLFVRETFTAVFTLALPLLILYILGGVFGNTPDPEGVIYAGRGAMDYYVPAYIGLATAALGFISLPVHLAEYRERGVLRRFRASTVPVVSLLGAQALVTMAIAAVGSGLLVTAALLFSDAAAPSSPALVLLAFLVVAACFAGIGILLGSVLPTGRAAQAAGVLIWFVEMFLAGAGPPPEVLPDALVTIGKATPLWHAVRLLQDPWWGVGWNWGAFGIVAGILAGCVLVAWRVFRWE